MELHHVGIEVRDLYAVELFYRKALGFRPRYHYVSRNSPGLRTVFLERDGVQLELLERPRAAGFAAHRAHAPDHVSLQVPDVDAEHARLVALGFGPPALRPPRDTGDGFRELELRDPEGNVVELSARIRPEPHVPVRAVIFDMDGTLIDSEGNYFLADRDVLASFGIPFTEEDKRRYIGCSNLEQMMDFKQRFGLQESAEELGARKNRLYMVYAEANTKLFPAMKAFWDGLKKRGVPVAVASGSAPAVLERLLTKVGLASEVKVVVSSEEVPRGKPAPDVFLEAARRLGVAPQECVVVEDSQYGVEAAARAFMRSIAVPYLTEPPLPDAFLMADLLFAEGMATFDPAAALAWLEPLREERRA